MTLIDTTITVDTSGGVDAPEDLSDSTEWEATWEERIDGVGAANLVIQDRDLTSSIEYGRGTNRTAIEDGTEIPFPGNRDIVQVSIPGLQLYVGEVIGAQLDLPAGRRIRRWALNVTDLNSVMDLRLVGVPGGQHWETIDGGQTYTAFDPDAVGLATDSATVAALFTRYGNYPENVPPGSPYLFDVTTYVHDWIPTSTLIDPLTGLSRLQWTNSTLRGAIDELRGLAGFPVFCWIDPDKKVHWEAFADWSTTSGPGLSMMFPATPFSRPAPARITDVTADVDGDTVVGGRRMSFKYDGTYMPQLVYVAGVTDFIRNADGSTTIQGTGWPMRASGDYSAINPWRQVMVEAQTVTAAQKQSVAAAYQNYAYRARLRGTVTVGSPTEAVDGWRVGQLLTVTDARLPPRLNGRAFPIQRVAGKTVKGQKWREYVLEFGDFPIGQFSQKYRTTPQRLGTARMPAKEFVISWPTHHLRPDSTYTLVAQMVDRSKRPVRHAGIPPTWEVTTLDASGASVGGGSISPLGDATDIHGRCAAVLATDSATGLHYHVRCFTEAQL